MAKINQVLASPDSRITPWVNWTHQGTITEDTGYEQEPISLQEAKEHLRAFDNEADSDILRLIGEARDYCERCMCRTLRLSVARTMHFSHFEDIHIDHPPLLSIESIQYYDPDNVLQTLVQSLSGLTYVDTNPDNPQPLAYLDGFSGRTYRDTNPSSEGGQLYWVSKSTDGRGGVVWATDFTPPDTSSRPDAVVVNMTTGYGSRASVPAMSKHAIKLVMSALYDNINEKAAEMCMKRAQGLMKKDGWGYFVGA